MGDVAGQLYVREYLHLTALTHRRDSSENHGPDS